MFNKIIKEDMEDIFNRNIEWKKLTNTTILVTGAYGMLASYVVLFLCYLNEYHDMNIHILVQGRSEDKARERFEIFFDKEYFDFVSFNLLNPIENEYRADYIIHAAGGANPRLYDTNPVEIIEPNIIGTYNLLQLARFSKSKGFLYFSSGDVYGKVFEPDKIDETTCGMMDPLSIHSCYGESKRMAETLCVSFFREYNVPITIARIGHTYGVTMDLSSDPRVFASFMRNVLEKKDIEMLSDGTAKRPFCYLADAVAAYFTILLKGKAGEAYNVCNNNEFISMGEFADIVVSLDESHSVQVVYKNRDVSDRYVNNNLNKDNKPSDSKLKELGFNYHFSTRDGLERVYKYFKELF